MIGPQPPLSLEATSFSNTVASSASGGQFNQNSLSLEELIRIQVLN